MPKTLPYYKNHHLNHNSHQNQEKPQKPKTAQGDVRQDKRAETTARTASTQPALSTIPLRAQTKNSKIPRSQIRTVDNNRTVQLTIWVKPIVKAEILRLVDQGQRKGKEKLTPSSVAAALLERAVQGHIDMQYGALLQPVIEHVIDRRLKTQENRLALLLVRNYLVGEQNRGLTTYLVGRVPDMTPDILNDILDRTFQEAKKKLIRRSPELEELIREVKRWVINEDKQQEQRQGKGKKS